MKDAVGFSISGEFITEHARARWGEGAYSQAMKVLECLEGASHEQHLEILFGTKKLVGVNDLDIVEDSWDPASEYWDYPSYHEGIARGDDYQELKKLREEKAWNIAYDEWPYSRAGFVAHTYENKSWKKVEALVGAEKATEIFNSVQEEMIDRADGTFRRSSKLPETAMDEAEKDPADKVDPLTMMYAMAQQNLMMATIESGGDISSLPTMDAMMNRGSNVAVVLDDHMTSASGWLLPNGNYYGCGSMEHIGLAESLLKHIGSKFDGTGNAELIAESFGWVKISRSACGFYVGCKKTPTKKQFNRLWDYSVLHKKDYEEMVQHLKASKHDFAV